MALSDDGEICLVAWSPFDSYTFIKAHSFILDAWQSISNSIQHHLGWIQYYCLFSAQSELTEAISYHVTLYKSSG